MEYNVLKEVAIEIRRSIVNLVVVLYSDTIWFIVHWK